MAKNLYYNKKTKKFQSTPTTNQYGLTKVDNEEISRNSQKRKAENAAKESQWAKARQAREAEKQTESYKRQQAANERHKKNIQLEVRQGTDKFNRKQQKIASLNPTRPAKKRSIGKAEMPSTGSIGNARPLSEQDQALTAELKNKLLSNRAIENARKRYGAWESAVKGAGEAITAPFSGISILADKLTGKDVFKDNSVVERNKYDTNQAKTAHGKAYGAGYLGGMMLGSYALGGGSAGASNAASVKDAYNTAKDAAKAMHGLSEKQAAAEGVKAVLKTLGVNTAKELPKDLAMDTLPRLAEVMEDENMTNAEKVAAIASNIGVNALFNNISELPSLVGIGKDVARNVNSPKIPKLEAPTTPVIKDIQDAVQKQTDEAKKVLKEAEPIEEWTRNQLKAEQTIPKVEEPSTPKIEQPRIEQPKAETPADFEMVQTFDDPMKQLKYNELMSELGNLKYQEESINAGKAIETETGELIRPDDPDRFLWGIQQKRERINRELEDLMPDYNMHESVDALEGYVNSMRNNTPKTEAPKPAETPTEDLDFTAPADNTVNTVKYKPGTQEEALDTTEWIRDTANDVVTRHEDALTETAKKNVKRLNDGLDALDDAIRQGASPDEIAPLFKEVERAYGALDKNLQRAGVNELRKTKATSGAGGKMFFGDNPYNINNIMRKGRVVEIPTTPEGYIDVSRINQDDLVFNDDPIYDAGGHVMLDDEGIPKRKGVSVNLRQNMDANYGDDVLTAEQKISKVRSNTLQNAGIDNEQELADIIPEEDFTYWTQPEKTTYAAAENRLATDWQGSLEKYTKDYTEKSASDIRSAEDVDAMMLMRSRLNDMARNATDPTEKRQLYAQSRKVALNLRKAGTEAGRNIQAFAKWTRTPEGAITSAQGFAEDMVEKGLKQNPKMAKDIHEVGEEIENFLDQMEVDALSREEIENMIRQAIVRRKSLRNKITNGDIRKIADSIMNDKQYADIQKQLEFLSTGFEDVDAETLDRVQEIFEQAQDLPFDSKERVDLENDAYKLLANKIVPKGGSFRDKLDAWRYLAMLANPTTHIKNITGNEMFGQGMVSVKNSLAALLEEGADRVSKVKGGTGIDRTKAILTKADKPLLDAASNDALQNAYRELSGNKYYSTGEAIDNAIPAFNTKTKAGRFLNRASDFNTGLLNREDEWATLAKYRTSLAGFLKANGADASIFNATDDASKSLLESGREYAIRQAKEAAFHQDAPLMQKLSKFTQDLRYGTNGEKIASLAIDTVIPFKKTPANILKSAMAYSPAEFIKVAAEIPGLKKGRIKPADFIDDISKGVTGTAALGIGALLAHEGILKIGSSKSDEEQAFDTQTGRQNVALKVGNKYVALSELIPAAAPFIFGATIYESWKDSKGEENALNTLFSGMSAIAEGVTDMTMLSGIADTLNSVRYVQDKNEVFQKLGIDTLGNLTSQLLPTLGRKINTTIDDTKRSTYSDKTGALKTLDQEAKYLQTKIPGLQQAGEAMRGSSIPFLQSIGNRLALQPNIDVKGQVQESPGIGGMNNFLGRALENFVSPVKITNDESTVFDDERRRIANVTGETKVLPYIASKEANIKDVGQLTPEQWTQYRQQRGQLREQLATTIMDQDQFKALSDVEKAEYLTDIDSFTKEYAQSQFGKEMSGTNQKLANVYEQGGVEALITRMQQNKELNKAGLNVTDKLIDYLNNGGSVDNYLTFEKNITSINDKGNETVKKADFMKELSRLPKDQQEIFFNVKPDDISLTKAEQAAYDKGGAPAAVDVWKQEKAEKDQKAKEKEQKKSEQAKKANMSVEQMENVQQQLANAGAIDSPTTVEYYNRAKQTIPSLTPKSYANYLHQIGGNDYKISQKEMISYGNNNNLSEDDMNRYWNAFGNWKRNPVLVNGTWKAK